MPLPCLITSGSRYYAEVGGGGTDFTQILFSDNFQSGTLGATISGNGYATTHAKYSDAITGPAGEPKVLSDLATLGETENAIGWYWNYPDANTLGKGDEIWFRIKANHPSGYSFATDSNLKWMRVHQLGAGFNDLYYRDSVGGWRFQSEVAPDDRNFTGTQPIELDTWETFEWYVRLSDEVGSGNALVRFWKNGTFIGEFDVVKTLTSASDVSDFLIWRNYWNGGVPQTQTCYYADFAVAVKSAGWRDDTPYLSDDGGGRLFIGTGSP